MLVATAILLLAQVPPGVIAGKSTKSAHPSHHTSPKKSGKKSGQDNFRLYGTPPTWSPPDPDAAPTPKTAQTGKSGRTAGSSKTAKSALPSPSYDRHALTKTPKSTPKSMGTSMGMGMGKSGGKSMGMGMMGKSGHVHTAKSAEPSGQPTARPTVNPTNHPTARPTPTADEVLAAMGWGDLTTRAPRTPDVVVVAETETETERPAVAPGPIVNAHPTNASSIGAGAEGSNGTEDTARTVDDVDAELASGGAGDRTADADTLQATSDGGALRGVGSQTMIWAGAAFGVALVGVLLLGIRRVVGRRHTAGVGTTGGAAAAKKEKKSAQAKSKSKAKAAVRCPPPTSPCPTRVAAVARSLTIVRWPPARPVQHIRDVTAADLALQRGETEMKVSLAKPTPDSLGLVVCEQAVSTARALPDVPAAAADYTVASMPDGPDSPAQTSPTVADLDVDYAEPDMPEDPEHEMWCVACTQCVQCGALALDCQPATL